MSRIRPTSATIAAAAALKSTCRRKQGSVVWKYDAPAPDHECALTWFDLSAIAERIVWTISTGAEGLAPAHTWDAIQRVVPPGGFGVSLFSRSRPPSDGRMHEMYVSVAPANFCSGAVAVPVIQSKDGMEKVRQHVCRIINEYN